MLAVVTGGSGSGKSEYAEGLALQAEPGRKLYLATMMVWDEEGRARVRRHRRMREGKQFRTEEVFSDLEQFELPDGWEKGKATILLECMSNLVCNEFYRQEEGAFVRITKGIEHLLALSRNLIVVTNEVCSDGRFYGEETERYRRLLGEVNCFLAGRAQTVTEVVYGLPILWKQESGGSEGQKERQGKRQNGEQSEGQRTGRKGGAAK